MIKNFIKVISNPDLFTPTLYLEPDVIDYEGAKVIHVHVPPSSVKEEDLRMDLIPMIRRLAVNQEGGAHPWKKMDDLEILRSANLYGVDRVTGEQGYNLAAVMLLGKDDVILDVAPAYVTDAIVRKVNIDRYDDREVVKTNLIESYDRLMDFGKILNLRKAMYLALQFR